MFMLGEGGEERFKTNINYLLEQWGITIHNDSVIRTVYFKYFHPREVCIDNGVLNSGINKAAGKRVPGSANNRGVGAPSSAGIKNSRDINNVLPLSSSTTSDTNITFVYPYGATLSVEKPAISILSSGHIAYPVNRTIGAVYMAEKGRVVVLGSVHMFEDAWLEKEENGLLQEVLFKWLLRNRHVQLNMIDAESPDINDYHYLPDTKSLASHVKPCMEESEALPKDFTKLFSSNTFKFDTNLLPVSIKLYEKLNVKHEPLTLIPPVFETPLPSLNPAVYPPSLRDAPPPALDLFDLDEQFASEDVRIAHLTNRCTNTVRA